MVFKISMLDQSTRNPPLPAPTGRGLPESYISLYIPFEPDELIIRAISYYNPYFGTVNEQTFGTAYVYTNIVNDNSEPVGYISNNFVTLAADSHFSLKKPLPQSMIVKILDEDGALVTNRLGLLTLICEFVKYK